MKKNVLFIAPIFFGYYKDIISELNKQGYEVFFFDDRPSDGFLTKALIRLNKKSQKVKINRYVKKILTEVNNKKLDLVFIILGQSFSREHILKIKEAHPEAEYVYYSWDSVKNFPNILEFDDCFDRVYHFDSRDAKEYGFNLLPLYYSRELDEKPIEYSLSAVFTVKRGKLKKFQRIMELIPNEIKKNAYLYLYLQSKLVYRYYKIKYKEFEGSKMRDFKFVRLDKDDFYDIMSKSKVIVDCQMKNQSGLTMRTMEALRAKKKLITTNPNIIDYEFYTPNNICIINKDHLEIPSDFFDTPFDDQYRISDKYSLESFIHIILGGQL